MADKKYGGDRGDDRGRNDRGRPRGSRPDRGSGGRGSSGRVSSGRGSSGRGSSGRGPAGGGTGRGSSGRGDRQGGERRGGDRQVGGRGSDGRTGGSSYDNRRSNGSTFDSRRPAGQRPGSQRPDGGGYRGRRPGDDQQQRERRLPPGLEPKPGEPAIPADTDIRQLDRWVRAELRSLPKELAEIVAGHLLLAGRLIDEDPELAHAHAEAARRRAARLPIVREGAAETAYAAGKYEVALGEYRALRRMTGSADYLPVMADCERALGRPQQALRLVREAAGQPMEPASAVELRIIEAGARHDLGQTAEAARLLRAAIKGLGHRASTEPMRVPAARLHYALGDILLDLGDATGGYREFVAASDLDTDAETDARERVDALDGLNIDFDESDDESDTDTDDGTDAPDTQGDGDTGGNGDGSNGAPDAEEGSSRAD